MWQTKYCTSFEALVDWLNKEGLKPGDFQILSTNHFNYHDEYLIMYYKISAV